MHYYYYSIRHLAMCIACSKHWHSVSRLLGSSWLRRQFPSLLSVDYPTFWGFLGLDGSFATECVFSREVTRSERAR